MKFRIAVSVLLLLPSLLGAAEKPKESRREKYEGMSRQWLGGKPIELGELKIQARIYEPQVIYILDSAKLDVDVKEEEVDFRSRIFDPIEENRF